MERKYRLKNYFGFVIFPFFNSYYCSNRIFEIDTKNRTKVIRMKLKRKESVQLLKKKIFIKIIFLVRGEKVNWNCIGQIIFFHGRSLFFEKIDFRKCAGYTVAVD